MEESKLDKYYEVLKVLRANDISSEIYLNLKRNFLSSLNMLQKEVYH